MQVLRAWHRRSTALILRSSGFFLFFFGFSQKLSGRVTRNIEKKAHGLIEQEPTGQNETFHDQSVPELSGAYGSIWKQFDFKSVSSITSQDFSDVYWYSGLQALFVAVCRTSVNLLCKICRQSYSLLWHLDRLFPVKPLSVGCCSWSVSCLSQIRREKFRFASNINVSIIMFVLLFWATAVISMPRLANFSPCDPLHFFVFVLPTLYARSLLKSEFCSNGHW